METKELTERDRILEERVLDAITTKNPETANLDEARDAMTAIREEPPLKSLVRHNWVGALRSGSFPQTRGTLRRLHDDGDRQAGFCCLGVLSCIDSKVRYDEDMNSFEFTMPPALDGLAGQTQWGGALPPEQYARERWGMSSSLREHLATLNDNGVDFFLIADVIEEYL